LVAGLPSKHTPAGIFYIQANTWDKALVFAHTPIKNQNLRLGSRSMINQRCKLGVLSGLASGANPAWDYFSRDRMRQPG
jgi:hypothetical protein